MSGWSWIVGWAAAASVVAGTMGAAGARAAQPAKVALGAAEGKLTLNGQAVVLAHAAAIEAPYSWANTKRAHVVLLTAKPLTAAWFEGVRTPDPMALLEKIDVGLLVEFGPDGKTFFTFRHPTLDPFVLKPVFTDKAPDVAGPDRVEGTVANSDAPAEEEFFIAKKPKMGFNFRFNAPVRKRFP